MTAVINHMYKHKNDDSTVYVCQRNHYPENFTKAMDDDISSAKYIVVTYSDNYISANLAFLDITDAQMVIINRSIYLKDEDIENAISFAKILVRSKNIEGIPVSIYDLMKISPERDGVVRAEVPENGDGSIIYLVFSSDEKRFQYLMGA